MAQCDEELDKLREEIAAEQSSMVEELWQRYVATYLACYYDEEAFDLNAVTSGTPEYLPSIAESIVDSLGFSKPGITLEDTENQVQAQILAFECICEGNAAKNVDTGADPVVLHSGEFVHQQIDLYLKGAGFDFSFQRTYRNQAVFNGPLGFKWTHNYNVRLREGHEVLFLLTDGLSEEPFTRHPRFGTSLDFDYWMPPNGRDSVMFEDGASFSLRTPNGSIQRFERDPTMGFLHRLLSIEDRFGNYHRLKYEDNRLVEVEVNHPMRAVRFQYDPHGRICEIVDFMGRNWLYEYDSHGDLISVTSPPTDRYASGTTVVYYYSSNEQSGSARHNLVRIVDGNGDIYLENEFGTAPQLLTFNRVVRQRLGDGLTQLDYEEVVEEFDFDYPPEQRPTQRTSVISPNGQTVCHTFNRFGNLLRREQRVCVAGQQQSVVEQYRYDRDGHLIGSLSPEGALRLQLYGREFFARSNGVSLYDDIPTANLTWRVRQSFSHLLSKVSYKDYLTFANLASFAGEWGSLADFLDRTRDPNGDNIIQKFSYEVDYGQLQTISDPRFTQDPAPNSINEHPRFQETATEFLYDGPPGDPNRFLVEIRRPAPSFPDSSMGQPIVETFRNTNGTPAYDERGRLLRHTDAVGTVREHRYFPNDPLDTREGFLHSVLVDPNGLSIKTVFDVDELGRIIRVHLPKSFSTTDGRYIVESEFNALDQKISVTTSKPFEFRSERFYDRVGNLEREERLLTSDFESGASREVRSYCYDSNLRLIHAAFGGTDPSDQLHTRHCYDSEGNRVLTTLPSGNKIRYGYDERGLMVSKTSGALSADESTIRFLHDGDERIVQLLSARGNATLREYDAFDRLVFVIDALGSVICSTYDKLGNNVCERRFEERLGAYFLVSKTEAVHDELGRQVVSTSHEFQNPIGPVSKADLNRAFLNSSIPNSVPLTKQYFYDDADNLVRSIDAEGHVKTYAHDAIGRLRQTEDSNGSTTSYSYDEHGNITREDRIERILDPADESIVLGQRTFSKISAYDELDRVMERTDALGNLTTYEYDERDNLLSEKDALGNTVDFEYDIFNRRTARSMPLTATGLGGALRTGEIRTSFVYDRNGNVIGISDANGQTTSYSYDEHDRLRSVEYLDGSSRTYEYDKDHHIIVAVDNRGVVRRSSFDQLGRLTNVAVDTTGAGGSVIGGASFERYAYDSLGRRVYEENDFCRCENNFNSIGWPIGEAVSFLAGGAPTDAPFVIKRRFNRNGGMIELEYPNGRKVEFARDALDRIQTIRNVAKGDSYPGRIASPEVQDIARFEFVGLDIGRVVNANESETSYRYDRTGSLIEISHSIASSERLTMQYLRDGVSNVRVKAEFGPADSTSTGYFYDSAYRLLRTIDRGDSPFQLGNLEPPSALVPSPITSVQSLVDTMIGSLSVPMGSSNFEYDGAGNRLAQRDPGDLTYAVNGLSQYVSIDDAVSGATEALSYDLNGNLRGWRDNTFFYDSLDRLVRVASGGATAIEFFHDARGRRILEVAPTARRQLIYDSGNLISEYHSGDLRAHYVFGDSLDRPVQLAVDGDEHWYHGDLVGSVRILSNSSGSESASYSYEAFGALTSSEATSDPYNPHRYAARRFDFGLEQYDYRSRQYDPELGRFLQMDPSVVHNGENPYTYAENNPTSFFDQLGLEREEAKNQPAQDKIKRLQNSAEQEPDEYAWLKRDARGTWRRRANRKFKQIVSWDFPWIHPVNGLDWFASEAVATFGEAPLDAPYDIAKATERAGVSAAQAYQARTWEESVEKGAEAVAGLSEGFLGIATLLPTPSPRPLPYLPKLSLNKKVNLPPIRTGIVEVDLQNTANYLHSSQSWWGRRRNTIAVGLVELEPGFDTLVYTVSGNRTSTKLRLAADLAGVERWTATLPKQSGRRVGHLTGGLHHAEQIMMEAASINSLQLKLVSPSRNFCLDCAIAVPDGGVVPVPPGKP